MVVTMLKRIFVALVFIFELQHFNAQVVASPIEIPTNGSIILPPTALPSLPLQNELNNSTSNGTKLLFRKCCELGQVYMEFRCSNYSSSSHPKLLNENPHLIFLTADQSLHEYDDKNFQFVTGFPANCDQADLYQFYPDEKIDEQFYFSGSGQVIFHQMFMYLNLMDYCIEESVENEDYSKTSRYVHYCYDDLQYFPEIAVSDDGKLQLDFLDSAANNAMSSFVGKKVISKCCNLNFVHDYDKNFCVEFKGPKSQFFEDLQVKNNDTIFFRIDTTLKATDCPLENVMWSETFKLTSSGGVQVEQESSSQFFPAGYYCIEDVHATNSFGLPEVTIKVKYCSEQPQKTPEHVDPIDFDVNDTIHETNNYEVLKKINLTKCCAPGSVIVGESCQPLRLVDKELNVEPIVTNALNVYLFERYNISASFLYTNVSTLLTECGIGKRSFNSTPTNVTNESSLKMTYFFENNKILMHYYQENLWDFHKTLHACVDLELHNNLVQAVYQDQLHHCEITRLVSNHYLHYPIFLIMSSIALFATFIIYFLVPTSGSAKVVTSMGGAKKKTAQTMAMALTGRILLCHVITLAVSFLSLAITQVTNQLTGKTFCIFLGYVIYSTSLASFAWLAVFCFDYCRIFRGSFKVSNDVLFLPYSAFGWGVPLLAFIVTSVVQFQSTNLGVPSSVNPNIGLFGCWFAEGGKSEMIFFYIPVSLLMLLNIAFFLTLLFNDNLMNCWKGKRNASLRTNKTEAKLSKEKQDLIMAVKLFFIAGIPWIFEIMAWLTNYIPDEYSTLRKISTHIFGIATTLNSLRGIAIFILFVVLQRDSRRYLWNGLKRHFPSIRQTPADNGLSKAKAGSSSNLNENDSSINESQPSYLSSEVTSEDVVSDSVEPNTIAQPEDDEITQL